MTEQIAVTTSQDAGDKAGTYLTFILAEEEYGLEILKVREIIGMMEVTAVPRTPDYVKGIINLRGKVIAVVDLRLKVGMTETERTDQTCIIVVDVGDVEMGIIVDRVSEVLDIAGGDIEDAPSFGAEVNTEFILGMGKAEAKVTILLDISKLLSQSELDAIEVTTQLVGSSEPAEPTSNNEAQPAQEESPEELTEKPIKQDTE